MYDNAKYPLENNIADTVSINGVEYDIFTVEYWDDGGDGQVTDLWFKADLKMDIQPGYVFQH